MKTKICRKCNTEYPQTKEFFHSKGKRNGIEMLYECKLCFNKRSRIRYNEKGTKRDTSKRNKNITRSLFDEYVIQLIYISIKKSIPKKIIKKNKELIELYRLNLKLKRELKKQLEYDKKT